MRTHVTLITGGTGGLGKAVTKAFLDRGDRVVATYRSEASRKNFLTGFSPSPANLTLKSVDLSDLSSVKSLILQAVTEFGTIDHVIHLAGGFAGGQNVETTTLETFDLMLALNLRSAFYLMKEVLPVLKRRNHGTIVTVASKGALHIGPGTGAYAASKAALIALTQTVAAETGKGGIRANVVAPGMIDTEANRQAMPDADRSGWTAPESIARTILFLSSKDSEGVNGSVISM
ncbi:MAG: SDR family oxidoreductase [Blastocatellia bacterium]|nr:SDR family oxidoreductase [Blastocatellia bacterium]